MAICGLRGPGWASQSRSSGQRAPRCAQGGPDLARAGHRFHQAECPWPATCSACSPLCTRARASRQPSKLQALCRPRPGRLPLPSPPAAAARAAALAPSARAAASSGPVAREAPGSLRRVLRSPLLRSSQQQPPSVSHRLQPQQPRRRRRRQQQRRQQHSPPRRRRSSRSSPPRRHGLPSPPGARLRPLAPRKPQPVRQGPSPSRDLPRLRRQGLRHRHSSSLALPGSSSSSSSRRQLRQALRALPRAQRPVRRKHRHRLRRSHSLRQHLHPGRRRPAPPRRLPGQQRHQLGPCGRRHPQRRQLGPGQPSRHPPGLPRCASQLCCSALAVTHCAVPRWLVQACRTQCGRCTRFCSLLSAVKLDVPRRGRTVPPSALQSGCRLKPV